MLNMKKLILVVGGAGFIGSHTVDLLLQEGYKVRVLDNMSTGRRENLPVGHPDLDLIIGSMADDQLLQEVFNNVDAVLHLAAQVSVQGSFEYPIQSCEQNTVGFLRVLEQARRNATRIVYASSAAVYGEPKLLPLPEEGTLDPVSPYGIEKYTNELYAALYQKAYGISVLGLRYFNVYGSRQDPKSPYSGVISRFVDQLRSGKPLTVRGDGLQERDFIHVHDIAKVNLKALIRTCNGVVNIASGTKTTVRYLAELLIDKNGGQGAIQWAPMAPGDILRSQADNSLMKKLLTSPKVSLKNGIQELLEYSSPV